MGWLFEFILVVIVKQNDQRPVELRTRVGAGGRVAPRHVRIASVVRVNMHVFVCVVGRVVRAQFEISRPKPNIYLSGRGGEAVKARKDGRGKERCHAAPSFVCSTTVAHLSESNDASRALSSSWVALRAWSQI